MAAGNGADADLGMVMDVLARMEAKIDRLNERVGGLEDGQQGLTARVGNVGSGCWPNAAAQSRANASLGTAANGSPSFSGATPVAANSASVSSPSSRKPARAALNEMTG